MEESTGGTSAVVESAPASTAAPSSTPASPSSSSPTVDRPTSFAEALTRAAETAPANPGESKPVGEPTPAAATVQPPTAAPPVESAPSTENQGPIPFARHQAALQNARTKSAEEAGQKFQQQYASHVELGNRFEADPVGTAIQVIRGLSQHAELGPQVISALARELGSRRGQNAAPQQDQEPQADLQTSDGTLVFSAEQLAKRESWQRQQLMQEVDQRLTPLQQREQQAQARERHEGAVKDAHSRMSKVLAPYQALPEFTEHRPAIAARTKSLMDEGHDPQTALGLAVTHVLREVVLPSRAAQSQQQLQASAVQKALGSTSAPGSTPSAPAGRPRSFEEAFRRVG